jgi:hypothetical protein
MDEKERAKNEYVGGQIFQVERINTLLLSPGI